MPLIYSAANLVEAQLVVDELLAGGIRTRITGSYLSGAIGELPPSEVIGVWLDEPRHDERARMIIEAFEASRQQPERDWRCSTCGESAGREFGACWKCGQPRPF
ncbi:putative signal transducing protein [Granulosicoccus sp. 3-233]|uniref:putative signal transducing protein n=1 Tax=Granulosicoccus sp. 3-233 TaxID=3417969 RepID=UPI003D345D64